jgi:hypothetical protein
MQALVSASNVRAETQVTYTRGDDGSPVTSISLTLRRDDQYAADTSAEMYIDYAQPVTPTFKPIAGEPGGTYELRVNGWIEHLRINGNVGSSAVYMEADRAITNPDEANILFPDRIVLGDRPPLRWDGQGSPYKYSLLYATMVPSLRFGFLAALEPDKGTFTFDKTTFTAVGSHTVGLDREVDYEPDGADSSQASLIWTSEWQRKVQVVESPDL